MATAAEGQAVNARALINLSMARALKSGRCVDLAKYRNADLKTYTIPADVFREDVDYCDAELEKWIWSVGRNKNTGAVFAATDARFYEKGGFECLWLR